jgi:rod shape-determining protein MreB and related proteins
MSVQKRAPTLVASAAHTGAAVRAAFGATQVGFNPINSLFGAFSRDLGIDLGTANTLVHVRGKGIVISEPSVVAIDSKTKQIQAVGAEAKAMVGKTPANIVAVRPLKDGVIADFDAVEKMLAYFIKKAHAYSAVRLMDPRPRVVVGVPSGVTEVEKRAARDATLNAKAREAYVVEEPMAAAIGAGLPVDEPIGSMIVDIGGGTTEVAVISLGGIVINHSIRTAGDEIDEAIIQFARREYNLLIGERMAERAKIAAGSAYPLEEEIKVVLRGRDLLTGLPKAVEVSSVEIREGIAGPVNAIVQEVRLALEETPPELASRSPAAARCCTAWTSASPPRRRCRCISPRTRSPAWPAAPARWSRTSARTRSTSTSSPAARTTGGRSCEHRAR